MGFFDRAREEMRKGFAEGVMEGLNEMSDDDPFKKKVNNVIKSTEAVIDIYIEHFIRDSSREEYIGPKGLTDVIGGMYGNTAIRRERKVKFTPAKTKWKKDKLIVTKDGFQIFESKQFFLYDDLNSVRVYDNLEKNKRNMGPLVEIKYKNSFYVKFRTPQAYQVQRIINNKIKNENTSTIHENFEMPSGMPSAMYETSIRDIIDNPHKLKKANPQETSNNMYGISIRDIIDNQDKLEITKPPETNNINEEKTPETTGMPSAMYDISIRDIIDNPDKIEITKPPETSNKNEETNFSVADELMKFGELYKQGLLTEEEFNAMKKKLLEL